MRDIPGTARSNASAMSHLSRGSNMSEARLEKLMRLQHRENSKPRISSRSRSQASNRNPYNQRPITGLSNAGPGLNRSASAMSFRDQQPSRPATGMSQMDQYDSWRPATGAIDEDAEYYGEDGAGGGGASMYDDSMGPPPKTGATEVSIAAEDVVDEWALLNELDITAYQLEQEQRRREEAEQKFKVRARQTGNRRVMVPQCRS